MTGQVHASNGASAPGSSNNIVGPSQTIRRPADTYSLGLTTIASYSEELKTDYLLCPSHGLLFHASPDARLQMGPSPMDRYLMEGPASQHALFVRPDTGKLSTMRACTCRARIEAEHRQMAREG